jgi:hypothetical protein
MSDAARKTANAAQRDPIVDVVMAFALRGACEREREEAASQHSFPSNLYSA